MGKKLWREKAVSTKKRKEVNKWEGKEKFGCSFVSLATRWGDHMPDRMVGRLELAAGDWRLAVRSLDWAHPQPVSTASPGINKIWMPDSTSDWSICNISDTHVRVYINLLHIKYTHKNEFLHANWADSCTFDCGQCHCCIGQNSTTPTNIDRWRVTNWPIGQLAAVKAITSAIVWSWKSRK